MNAWYGVLARVLSHVNLALAIVMIIFADEHAAAAAYVGLALWFRFEANDVSEGR